MKDSKIEEELEKYPKLKKISDYILFTTQEDFEKLQNGKRIKIGSQEISIDFLKRILNDDLYYDYATRYFKGDINNFSVSYIINGDSGSSLNYHKSIIIGSIDRLVSSNIITLEPIEQERLDTLKNYISFDAFLEKHKDKKYDIEIDGNKYSIPIKTLIDIMQLPIEDFDNLCFNPKNKDIDGILNEHIIYAAYQFLKESKALEDYTMPNMIIRHYVDVESLDAIDIEALNKHLTTPDTVYKEVKIDENLEKEILSGMPEESTDLEKAIYIYIKMCKLLTYDEEYYAVNQRGKAIEKHQSIDHVSTITPENNKVVCYEFNVIYSKLLNQLGLNFSSDYKSLIGEYYGGSHSNLEFRSDKFLVQADSVTTILNGDIMQAKLNQPLVGLKCINKNKQTQQEFKESVTKMYKLIAEQEKSISENQEVEHIQTLDELLEEYSKSTNNIKDVSFEERLSILIDKVNSTAMVGVDSLSYVLQLRKVLFTEEQRDNNLKVTIVKNSEPFDLETTAMASAIFTLNDQSFEENPEQNIYYYYNPNQELIPITKEELQDKFNQGVLSYIQDSDPKIPGIKEDGGMKK